MTEAGRRLCSIEGCGNPHEARGWCPKHYMRWQRNGDPEHVDLRMIRADTILRVPISEVVPERRAMALAGQRRFEKLMAKRLEVTP